VWLAIYGGGKRGAVSWFDGFADDRVDVGEVVLRVRCSCGFLVVRLTK
jgi:hypothetical protein